MLDDITHLLAGVPRGLWFAALVYAVAVSYNQLAGDDRGESLVGLSVVIAVGAILIAPTKRFLLEPYYVWVEYSFIGVVEWIFLAVVPKLAAVFLSMVFVPLAGMLLASPIFLLAGGDTESRDSSNSLDRSYTSRSSSTDSSTPSDYVELDSAERSTDRSRGPPPSDVSENDGVKYNDKGELVRDE